MKVLVSGSSGLIGSALSASLRDDGHEVVALPRTYEEPIDFSGVDAVVHLAGESIAGGRWTAARKQRIEESRIVGTRQLAEQLAGSADKPEVFICASAIGFYGDSGDELLDEESGAGEGFLSNVCKKWEAAARPTDEAGIRTLSIRTGVVLSTEGGALKKMLMPFRMGGGGILGNGRQYMSWISLGDMVRSIRFLIDTDSIGGAVNLVSPNPVTNREFTKTLGQVLHRPTILPLPAFAARILFGEMADELLLGGCRVIPQKLLDAGYQFRNPDLQTVLVELLRQ
ncbi:MAG: TIGR01777 family oxidoreductase [Kiritimatiellales bacterium]|nr:TIGR01777 family oxidoreductase [Kiritimatiellales bacterium]